MPEIFMQKKFCLRLSLPECGMEKMLILHPVGTSWMELWLLFR